MAFQVREGDVCHAIGDGESASLSRECSCRWAGEDMIGWKDENPG